MAEREDVTLEELGQLSDDLAASLSRCVPLYLGFLHQLQVGEWEPARAREPLLMLARELAFFDRLADELAAAYLAQGGVVTPALDPRRASRVVALLESSLLLMALAETRERAQEEPLAAPAALEAELQFLDDWLSRSRASASGS